MKYLLLLYYYSLFVVVVVVVVVKTTSLLFFNNSKKHGYDVCLFVLLLCWSFCCSVVRQLYATSTLHLST
jgi:hypothetical protein